MTNMFNKNFESFKAKIQQFKEWQRQPYQVKPLSEETHECGTCGTHFQGNYCPRCGQSGAVNRYSFKNTFLLFLDVWGLGNRSMFRTIRDLLLRPGYMIRDYLQGMQMAYFPPFKMFFLVIAFSVLVDSGMNIKGEYKLHKFQEDMHASFDETRNEIDSVFVTLNEETQKAEVATSAEESVKSPATADSELEKEKAKDIMMSMKTFFNWMMENQTLFMLIWLLVLSGPLYLFFRHCPAIPDLRYSEFFVAMVYTTNMMNIVSSAGGMFCLDTGSVDLFCYALSIIPLKQLSGYGYLRTFFYIACAFIILFITLSLIAGGVAIAFGLFQGYTG